MIKFKNLSLHRDALAYVNATAHDDVHMMYRILEPYCKHPAYSPIEFIGALTTLVLAGIYRLAEVEEVDREEMLQAMLKELAKCEEAE
jgi:hypothetical protein